MPILPQQSFWKNGQIASGITVAYVTTNASIPGGWSRVSALDGKFPKQIPNNLTNPGTTGGATTHTHPFGAHAHSYDAHNHGSWTPASPTTTLIQSGKVGGVSVADGLHTHGAASTTAASISMSNNTAPANTDTQTSDPNHVTTIFIQSNGTPTTIPSNAVVWYNGAAPTDYAVYSALDNRFQKGAAAGGDGGASLGTTTHTHTSASHTHPIGGTHLHAVSLAATGTPAASATASATNIGSIGHEHALGNSGTGANPTDSDGASDTNGNGDIDPPWQKMRAITPSGGARPARAGIIVIWTLTLASIPATWKLCDGTSGTPNLCQGKYVRGAASDAEVGNTGGATTHTHIPGQGHAHGSTATHSHTITAGNGIGPTTVTGIDSSVANVNFSAFNHDHASTTYTSSTTSIGTSTTVAPAQAANSSNDPPFYEVAYIQKS